MISIWLKALRGRVWPYIAAIGAAFGAVLAIRQSGKAAGRREAEITRIKETEKAKEKAREIDQKIDSLDSDDLDRRGKRWVRHNRKR